MTVVQASLNILHTLHIDLTMGVNKYMGRDFNRNENVRGGDGIGGAGRGGDANGRGARGGDGIGGSGRGGNANGRGARGGDGIGGSGRGGNANGRGARGGDGIGGSGRGGNANSRGNRVRRGSDFWNDLLF
jgi:hypothetical protein